LSDSLFVHLRVENRDRLEFLLVPIISPYNKSREQARDTLTPRFYEYFLKADLKSLINRDPKGLYSKSIKGELNNLICFLESSLHEAPDKPDIILDTFNSSIDESVSDYYNFVIECLKNNSMYYQ